MEPYKPDSLINRLDYRNLLLVAADPHKEYLWNSNDEAFYEYEASSQKKIVHGRVIS